MNHIFSTPIRWVILIIGLVIGLTGVVLLAPPSSLAQGDATPTPTPTIVPTLVRPTVVSTGLPTIGGPTRTRTRVPTSTRTPSATITRTSTPTHTRTQTASPTSSFTATQRASDTFTPFPTNTLVATTLAPTSTNTAIVTQVIVPSSVSTLPSTASPTDTTTYTPTVTASSTNTLTSSPTSTVTASTTATETPTSTPTATNTTTRVPAVVESSRPADDSTANNGGTSPLIFLAGIVLTGLIGGYIMMFAASQAAAERYAGGFVIQYCPVCYEGRLYMEERSNRVLGILRIRRTVRCDSCRSVLREVGKHRWRYAVDRTVSPEMYASLNNRLLREEQLIDLAPQDATQSPEYFEDAPDEF